MRVFVIALLASLSTAMVVAAQDPEPTVPPAEAAPAADAAPSSEEVSGPPGDQVAAVDPEPVVPEKETESDETVIASPPWHDSQLALPDWIPAELRDVVNARRPANQGGGLFPAEVWPLEPAPPLGRLEWPLPEIEFPQGNGDALPPPQTLSPELMASCFGQRPTGVLVDPQHLLPPDRVAGLESMVRKWMNEESEFPATVVLFGPTQQLPPDFDPAKIHADWFGNENALLVIYFYQRPERTLAFFSRDARATWGDTQLRGILDAAVEEAGRMPGPVEQLERFCYKSAVRLYWLPRTGVRQMDPVVAAEEVPASAFSRGLVWGLGVVILAGVAGAGGFWYRRRLQVVAATPVYFPDQDIQPRLGAAHSGGFSSTLQFGAPVNRL